MNQDMLDNVIRRCDTDEDEMLNYSEFSETVKFDSIATVETYPSKEDKYYWNSSPLWNTSPSREIRANYSPSWAWEVYKSP